MVSGLRTRTLRRWAVAVLAVLSVAVTMLGVTAEPGHATDAGLQLVDKNNVWQGIVVDVPDLADLGWNDRASRVVNLSPTNTYSVYLDKGYGYSNPNYLGDCQTLAPGQAVADLGAVGNLGSGRLSSFRFNATC